MAAPILDAITIEGFKSIASIRDLPLRRRNVLIGANGSGKSDFLGVFKLLQEWREGRHTCTSSKAGCSPIAGLAKSLDQPGLATRLQRI